MGKTTIIRTLIGFFGGVIVATGTVLGFSDNPKIKSAPFQDRPVFKETIEDIPNVVFAVHHIGDVWLTVTNYGQFGVGNVGAQTDPVTGMETPSCVFPARSDLNYLYVGSFWIGAIVGRDTLVSLGVDDYYDVREFWPSPSADIDRLSIQTNSPFYNDEARSEQDFIAVYSDTLTDQGYVSIDRHDGRPHVPLDIEITQRSYAWSYAYAQDFILFDYSIKNIGLKTLNRVFMGIYVDGDVHHESLFGPEGYDDDLCGFRRDHPIEYGSCRFMDTINIAYITDNNGDPDNQLGAFTNNSALGAAGVRVVRTPSDSLEYSFNWWVTNYSDASLDFGPRKSGTPDNPFRDMLGVLGTPLGDANKYYVMGHREFDYDQLYTGLDHTADGWLPRPSYAEEIARGYDARYLLSFGPFEISPGEVLPVSFAWVLGDSIHTDPYDYENYFNISDPDRYYEHWNFEDLAVNSRWASWIYDNPGLDTDGDGYSGKFRICGYDSVLADSIIQEDPLIIDTFWVYTVADTFYYEGDGVPDFKGASPPPPPDLWIIDTTGDTLGSKIRPRLSEHNRGELLVRWNGFRSETEKDVFSRIVDFEGYRIYVGDAPNPGSFSVVASYDIEDYNRYVYNPFRQIWKLRDTPFTLDSLKKLYGPDFDPLVYEREKPLIWNDTAYYFLPQDWNQSNLDDTLSIHKVYPDAPPPTIPDLDSARLYHPEELTPDGLFFKYYEYEFVLRNLLPSRLYYIAVTAFDFGSPVSGLTSLETKPINNFIAEYPQHHASAVVEKGLNVIVYPNPYRVDGGYRENGFEGRDYINNQGELVALDGLIDDRARAIHFINLPPKCTIRIFSIDGDLIRVINHDLPADHPQSGHEIWDLITRNTQAVVSGIYYYAVESDSGNQIGKIVIIM